MTKRQRLAAWYEKERRRSAAEAVTRRLRPQPQIVQMIDLVPAVHFLPIKHVTPP